MKYVSTRSSAEKVDAAQAIVAGLAPDGGLYVPESFPAFALGRVKDMAEQPYPDRAREVMGAYLTDFSEAELRACARQAYAPERFGDCPAPLKAVGDLHVLELWHGPTHAFKDMALQMLPRLMPLAMKKTGVDKQATRARPRWRGSAAWRERRSACSTPSTASRPRRSSR